MADRAESRVIRMTWDEWRASRGAKRAALEKKGLATLSRRTTARPEAREALREFLHRGHEVRSASREAFMTNMKN